MPIAQKEIGCVDEDRRAITRFNLECPEHRPSEGVLDGAALVGIGGEGAVTIVRLDHQDLRSDPIEADDVRLTELTAIEADRIRSHSGGERDLVEKLLRQAIDLHQQLSVLRIPIKRKEAPEFLQPGGVSTE